MVTEEPRRKEADMQTDTTVAPENRISACDPVTGFPIISVRQIRLRLNGTRATSRQDSLIYNALIADGAKPRKIGGYFDFFLWSDVQAWLGGLSETTDRPSVDLAPRPQGSKGTSI